MLNFLKYTAYVLVLIGALNWGLVGIFGFDLVAAIFGEMTAFSRIIYSLVGISAIVTALTMHHCDCIEIKDEDNYGKCRL